MFALKGINPPTKKLVVCMILRAALVSHRHGSTAHVINYAEVEQRYP